MPNSHETGDREIAGLEIPSDSQNPVPLSGDVDLPVVSAPPDKSDIRRLSRWGIAMFAARCARRAHYVCARLMPVGQEKLAKLLELVVAFIERSAEAGKADGRDSRQIWLLAGSLHQKWFEIPTTEAARTAVGAVRLAAQSLKDLTNGARERSALSAALNTDLLCMAAAKLGFESEMVDVIWADFEILIALADRNQVTDETPVALAPLGELWPKGVPDILHRRLLEKEPPPTAEEQLAVIDAEYAALRDQTRQAVENLLAEKAGKEFPSLEAKQAFATEIRDRLHRFGLRIACPKADCGKASALRAAAAGDSKHGVFQFDHGSRSTHGGSAVLPPGLKVVDAPIDRRVKRITSDILS